jgi:hypothetical protein
MTTKFPEKCIDNSSKFENVMSISDISCAQKPTLIGQLLLIPLAKVVSVTE